MHQGFPVNPWQAQDRRSGHLTQPWPPRRVGPAAVGHPAGEPGPPGPAAVARPAGAECRISLAPVPESNRKARDFTAATLRRWGLGGLIDDAVVVASELVANAIRHGTGDGGPPGGPGTPRSPGTPRGPGGQQPRGGAAAGATPAGCLPAVRRLPVGLAWRCHPGRLICVVTDHSRRPPVLMTPGPDTESGRGLLVVQALTAAWGWTMLGPWEKAVWAELAAPAP